MTRIAVHAKTTIENKKLTGVKEEELIELLNKHRKNDGSYDVLLLAAGKDSVTLLTN